MASKATEDGEEGTPPPIVIATYEDRANATIERMENTAKWAVGTFAALGVVLIAGTQLSSLGKVPAGAWMEEHRLALAFLAGTVALVAIGLVINAALNVLTAQENVTTLDQLAREEGEADGNQKRYGRELTLVREGNFLDHGVTVQRFVDDVRQHIEERSAARLTGDHDAEIRANDLVSYDNQRIRTIKAGLRLDAVRTQLQSAKPLMLGAGLAGGLAIGLFTWAANPPDVAEAPSEFANPAMAYAWLSESSQENLAPILGESCVTRPVYVTVLSVSDDLATIVTIAGTNCAVRQVRVPIDELVPAFTVAVPTPEPTSAAGAS